MDRADAAGSSNPSYCQRRLPTAGTDGVEGPHYGRQKSLLPLAAATEPGNSGVRSVDRVPELGGMKARTWTYEADSGQQGQSRGHLPLSWLPAAHQASPVRRPKPERAEAT